MDKQRDTDISISLIIILISVAPTVPCWDIEPPRNYTDPVFSATVNCPVDCPTLSYTG